MQTFNYGSEITVNNGFYYPIHLTSDHLSYILDCVIDKIHKANVIIGFVRKSQFKGVEYKIICSKNDNFSNAENIDREYSILINPNWSVQILDHWNSYSIGAMDSFVRNEIIIKGAEDLNKTIFEDILSKIKPSEKVEENTIFLKDEWVCIRKIKDVALI